MRGQWNQRLAVAGPYSAQVEADVEPTPSSFAGLDKSARVAGCREEGRGAHSRLALHQPCAGLGYRFVLSTHYRGVEREIVCEPPRGTGLVIKRARRTDRLMAPAIRKHARICIIYGMSEGSDLCTPHKESALFPNAAV